MKKLNHILQWDKEQGLIHCEAGITLEQMLRFIVPKGWFLPVTPGTKFVTLGGAIAADVHGKNHHKEGCLSQFVEGLIIDTGQGKWTHCSKQDNADLFWATCGGMGLTGIIMQATLRLKPIDSAYICQETCVAANLKEAMALFEQSAGWTYTVAWIDCLAQGNARGRSVLYRGEHCQTEMRDPFKLHRKPRWKIPFYAPDGLMRAANVRAFNRVYYARQRQKPVKQVVHYDEFFYPLDKVLHWNKLYGRKGFVQYQCVLPLETSAQGLDQLLAAMADAQRGSFLAVLKLFGASNPSQIMSFPFSGYTLALDFKWDDNLPSFIEQLDRIVQRHKGRIYLAKDALMSECLFREGYPKLNQFQSIVNRWRPQGMVSDQARRLNIMGKEIN